MPRSRTIVEIPLDQIRPSPYQYRQVPDDELNLLAESMRASGLSQPVLVRPLPGKPQSTAPNEGAPAFEGSMVVYELISGESRLRAAQKLAWPIIAAVVEEMSDAEAAMRCVLENELRRAGNIIERAKAFQRLTGPPANLSQERVALAFGLKDRSSVSRIIALLDQPPEIQEMLSRDNISEHHLRHINKIKLLPERIRIARLAAEHRWTVQETAKKVDALLSSSKRQRADAPRGLEVNGFKVGWKGKEVVHGGRNYKHGDEMLAQYLADLRTAIESLINAGGIAAEPPPTERSSEQQVTGSPVAETSTLSGGTPEHRVDPRQALTESQPTEVEVEEKSLEASLLAEFEEAVKAFKDQTEKTGKPPDASKLLDLFNRH